MIIVNNKILVGKIHKIYFQVMHYALNSRFNIEKNILQRNISFLEDCSRSMCFIC